MAKSNDKDKAPMFGYYWRVILGDADSVPKPTGEFEFDPVRGWRLDWAWPDVCVGVEVDGGQWTAFGGRHGHDADLEKTNALVEARWLVFHYSPQMLDKDPTSCVLQVARTVAWKMGLWREL